MGGWNANVALRHDRCDGWGDRDLYEISWIPTTKSRAQTWHRVFASYWRPTACRRRIDGAVSGSAFTPA